MKLVIKNVKEKDKQLICPICSEDDFRDNYENGNYYVTCESCGWTSRFQSFDSQINQRKIQQMKNN